MQGDLIVTQQVSSPHYISLQSGEKVDILDVMSDNQSVIVRRADGGIGYVAIQLLLPLDIVYCPHQSIL
jgi:hypothetical protein